MALLERQLTVGEKCFVGIIDSSFLSQYEKRKLQVAKSELCSSVNLKPLKLIRKTKKGIFVVLRLGWVNSKNDSAVFQFFCIRG